MEVEFNANNLVDYPYSSAHDHLFVFNEQQVEDFVNDLTLGSPTCYLVSGYRGVGKTSLIKKVEAEIEKINWEKVKTILPPADTVFVYTSFSGRESKTHLIRNFIRQLYLKIEKTSRYQQLQKSHNTFAKRFDMLHLQTFKEVLETSNTTHARERTISSDFSLTLFIQKVASQVAPLLALIPWYFAVVLDLSLHWMVQWLVPIGSVVWTMVNLVSVQLSYVSKKTDEHGLYTKTLFDDEIAGTLFLDVLRDLQQLKFRITFVLDELDKVNVSELEELIRELKPYLVCGHCNFIVVGGQNLYYKFNEDDALDDSVLSSLFSKVYHVSLASPIELRDLFNKKILQANVLPALVETDKAKLDAQLDYIIFQSRLIPRRFVTRLRQRMFFQSGRALFTSDERLIPSERHRTLIQAIDTIDDKRLQGEYPPAIRDYILMQLYILCSSYFRMHTHVGTQEDQDTSPFKKMLQPYASPYLESFRKLAHPELSIDGKELQIEAGIKEPAVNLETRKLIDQLRDLQAIAQIVHHSTENENVNLGNLVEYLSYFNAKGVTDVSLTDQKLTALLGNLNHLTDEDITPPWTDAVERAKLNYRIPVQQLLEYFTKQKVEALIKQTDFFLNPALREYAYDGILCAKADHSKLVLFDIKFRASIDDLKSIVLRSTQSLNDYKPSYENTRTYLIVIVYTMQQDQLFQRLLGQFQKLMVDQSESFLNRVFFIPVSMYRTEELSKLLEQHFQTIQGLEIVFGYEDSPLNHGWKIDERFRGENYNLSLPRDQFYGKVLEFMFPIGMPYGYLDYPLTGSNSWKFRYVTFVVQFAGFEQMYIELAVQGSSASYWFLIKRGDAPPEPSKGGREFVISIPAQRHQSWYSLSIDVQHYFSETFKPLGHQFAGIKGIRLAGSLTVAKIMFD
ncbi:MAG: ATP-binding protein [Chryseolinea sp.]